jgi:hypothetical protein
LKHLYIKEKFKEIGKFNCPKIEYFDKMIKNTKADKKNMDRCQGCKSQRREVSYN